MVRLHKARLVFPLVLLLVSAPAWRFGAEPSDAPAEATVTPTLEEGLSVAAPVKTATLRTYGSHQYWVTSAGNCCETALAVTMDGTVFTAEGSRLLRSRDLGRTWDAVSLPTGLLLNEGDVVVAPNGDVLSNWLSLGHPTAPQVWISKDGGNTFVLKPLVGPEPVPDRPWIVVGANITAVLPTDPSPYLAASLSLGGVWASGDRGETWFRPRVSPDAPPGVPPVLPGGLPALPANPFMGIMKVAGQGTDSNLVPLPGGEFLSVTQWQWTSDFLAWHTADDDWDNDLVGYHYWDVAADGSLWAVKYSLQAGDRGALSYKWFDGTWHTGVQKVILEERPNYCAGLVTSCGNLQIAIKTCDGMLAINTREGNQDILVRIDDATSANATITKENMGNPSTSRYDFPNLMFGPGCRAITTFDGEFLAYATTA